MDESTRLYVPLLPGTPLPGEELPPDISMIGGVNIFSSTFGLRLLRVKELRPPENASNIVDYLTALELACQGFPTWRCSSSWVMTPQQQPFPNTSPRGYSLLILCSPTYVERYRLLPDVLFYYCSFLFFGPTSHCYLLYIGHSRGQQTKAEMVVGDAKL